MDNLNPDSDYSRAKPPRKQVPRVRFCWSDESDNWAIWYEKEIKDNPRCYGGYIPRYVYNTKEPIIEIFFDGMRKYPKACIEGITDDLIHELYHWADENVSDKKIPW